MRTKVLLLITVAFLMSFVKCDCGDSGTNPDRQPDAQDVYQFPLAEGNAWHYERTLTTDYRWIDSVMVSRDTFTLEVEQELSNKWTELTMSYSGNSSQQSSSVNFKNTDDGVLVRARDGASPFFPFVDNGDSLTITLLPTENTPDTWEAGLLTLQRGDPDTLQLDGQQPCLTVELTKDGQVESTLYYNEKGIFRKAFSPDTLIDNTDTIVVTCTINLYDLPSTNR